MSTGAGQKTLTMVDGAKTRWARTLAALFPGGYTPDGGWTVQSFDKRHVIVASLGAEPGPGKHDLAKGMATAGIDVRTGRRLWSQEGTSLHCYGTLETKDEADNRSRLRCRYRGEESRASDPDMKDVAVEGFDPSTGRASWSLSVGSAAMLYDPTPVAGAMAWANESTVLIATPHRPSVVLDLTTGAHRAPGSGETFACSHIASWTSPEPWLAPDGSAIYSRNGGDLLQPCDAGGRAVTTPLSWTAAAVIGATIKNTVAVSTAREVMALTR